MAKVDPPPNHQMLENRRKRKWVVDPKDVKKDDELRVRQWGLDIMKKHEKYLDDKLPDKRIVARKDVSPEDIDIRNIYPFKDLWWMIYKNSNYWTLRICYKNKGGAYSILAELTYASVL